MSFIRKYGASTHIYTPIVKRAVVDFAVSADWTPAAGDVKVSLSGAAAFNIATLPTAITMGNGAVWDFTVSSTESSSAVVMVTVVDAATKAVEDQAFMIETFGNASSQYPGVDWSDSTIAVDAILKRDMSAVSGESARSPLNALRLLRNLWQIVGGTLTVTKEDDATTAWTAALTATPGADPITKSDPA